MLFSPKSKSHEHFPQISLRSSKIIPITQYTFEKQQGVSYSLFDFSTRVMIFDNLRNKNRVVLKSAWKVLRSLFKYHQNQFLFQEYPVIKDYFVLAIKDKDPEVFNNVLEQIILFLTKIIKYYTNEEKFISHRCCNNFLSISRTIKESEFNLEDSCIFIESEELNKREEYERKQVIIDYLECVKEKPFIEKFLENPEFRVEAPSMIFKERMKEFSFRKRKK